MNALKLLLAAYLAFVLEGFHFSFYIWQAPYGGGTYLQWLRGYLLGHYGVAWWIAALVLFVSARLLLRHEERIADARLDALLQG